MIEEMSGVAIDERSVVTGAMLAVMAMVTVMEMVAVVAAMNGRDAMTTTKATTATGTMPMAVVALVVTRGDVAAVPTLVVVGAEGRGIDSGGPSRMIKIQIRIKRNLE
jgi:hypothetical protein